MGEYDLHSLILACDFRVDDVDRMWKWLKKHRDGLASIGAHQIGIRQAGSVRDVLPSPAIFEWFSISCAADIPAVFGGEEVEKI